MFGSFLRYRVVCYRWGGIKLVKGLSIGLGISKCLMNVDFITGFVLKDEIYKIIFSRKDVFKYRVMLFGFWCFYVESYFLYKLRSKMI